ncbi:YeeE/YedE family protein, partial [Klebsiella pneumoniae]|nr:YeeE/YedE family protein [Klebsiella pneumoniae]
MNIDWVHFTPWSSALGGLLIGLAAAILLLFNGRIAGISGILGGVLTTNQQGNG